MNREYLGIHNLVYYISFFISRKNPDSGSGYGGNIIQVFVADKFVVIVKRSVTEIILDLSVDHVKVVCFSPRHVYRIKIVFVQTVFRFHLTEIIFRLSRIEVVTVRIRIVVFAGRTGIT